MQRNKAFKSEAERLLQKAEQDTFAPVKEQLNMALQQIGKENGYAFIFNTDNDAVPFINDAIGEDITNMLTAILK